MKTLTLYHSTSRLIIGTPKVKGICGYGFYLARTKKDSMTFGDTTYKISVTPKNTLTVVDNELKNINFFNISKESFIDYINSGFDSISWIKNGKIKEFIVLDQAIIKSKSIAP